MAVGSSGELYTYDDDGGIKAITVEQYKKSENKVEILTVAELLKARNDNASLAGANEIFKIANNSIGMSTISNHILKIVDALGEEKTTEGGVRNKHDSMKELEKIGIQLNGRTPNGEEMKGIKILSDIANSPTTYSSTLEENSTQRNHADKAINYIWSSLDINAQNKLTAQAALNNMNSKEFILNMVISGTTESYTTKVKPEKNLEEFVPGSKVGKEGAGTQISITPQELAHNDRLYKPGRSYSINLGGSETSVTASYVGPLLDLRKDGEIIGTGMVGNLMDNYNYSSILDKNQAYIGDVKVDQAMLNEVATTGEDVAKVYLPVNDDGSPDLGQMERFSDAYKVFEINRDKWSVHDVKEYFASKGFPDVNVTEETTETGQRLKVIGQSSSVKPFLALPVLSNSASDLAGIPWMVKSLGDRAKIDKELMKKAFTTVSGTAAKPKFTNNMPSGFFSLETPHRGMMFVAYRPEASAILSATQGNIKATPATDLDISRNLNHSNNNNTTGRVFGSAEVLTQ